MQPCVGAYFKRIFSYKSDFSCTKNCTGNGGAVMMTCLNNSDGGGLCTQVSPEILTRGQNQKNSASKNKGNFEYLWVGKV